VGFVVVLLTKTVAPSVTDDDENERSTPSTPREIHHECGDLCETRISDPSSSPTYYGWETRDPELVVVHVPEVEVTLGSLHPRGSLYATTTTRERAETAVKQLVKVIEKYTDSRVVTVRSALERLPHDELIELAREAIDYVYHDDLEAVDIDSTAELWLRTKEERDILYGLSNADLVTHIITRPTIHLDPTPINTGIVVSAIVLHPLSNLVFTRDQQIVTKKGIVVGRMNSPQRAYETVVMKSVWKSLGIPIVGVVEAPGTLEGGDFIMLDKDTSLLGIGLRTNFDAAKYLMDNLLFGTLRVALVYDDKDRSQDRMHLDTYFNVVSDSVVVLLETVAGVHSPISRTVMEYALTGYHEGHPHYEEIFSVPVEFSKWLTGRGYQVVLISDEHQREYMINFLNLGRSRLLSVHPDLARVLRDDGVTNVQVEYVDYGGVTAMYGAAHCTTQVLRRRTN